MHSSELIVGALMHSTAMNVRRIVLT